MAKILKSVAIAAGAGLAMGLTSLSPARRLGKTPAGPTATDREDDILDLEPLLDRLEALERRSEVPVSQAGVSDQELRALRAEIPGIVAAVVDARVATFEARIETELETQRRQVLDLIAPVIEECVTRKVAELEQTLLAQASSVASLQVRAEQTDMNLQRLIVMIERLLDGGQSLVDVPGPTPANASFQAHLAEAIDKESPETEVPVTGFRSRIFQEPEAKEARKPRFPLSRIF